MELDLRERYGPWGLIAGASEGIGEAFARQLAARGLHLVLVARREAVIQELAEAISKAHGVEVRALALDLVDDASTDAITAATAGLDVGLLVYNAAASVTGSFLDHEIPEYRAELAVNCRRPLELAHHFARPMAARGRGGILLMSSLAGGQGSPFIAHYGATKAWNTVMAEGLWGELRERGVDVLACRAGATRTPKYIRENLGSGGGSGSARVPLMEPADVAREALAALGSTPSMVPGRTNRLAAGLMQRLLPRRTAVTLMGRASRSAGVRQD